MTAAREKKLLYAWDMGSNWGHIGSLLALYPALTEAGFDCAAAIHDVRTYGARLAAHGVELFAAPRSEPKGRPPELPSSLAHILANRGFTNNDELLGMVLAWRSLLQAVKPGVILVDAAPAALLAAESLQVPSLLLTEPFFLPPADEVMPDLLPGKFPSPSSRRQQLSARVLQTVNEVRSRFGLPAIATLAGLYEATDRSIPSFSELDPHGRREWSAVYRGVLWNMGNGQPFVWPAGKGPRVFVYLRPPAVATKVLSVLQQLGWPTAACCPDLPAQQRQRFDTGSVRVAHGRLEMEQVAREAELAVTNGGHAVVAGLLWHGIPQLILPTDAEKELTARCVVTMGAAIRPGQDNEETITMALQQLDSQPAYRQGAATFARRYAHMNQQTVVASIVASCKALATAAP